MNTKTKKLTTIAMLCALSYVAMLICRIPVVLFLNYEPKDVLITMGGFLFGPGISFVVSLVVALVEMVTVSNTGLIGCLMNLLSSCAFSCTAAWVYHKKRTMSGAVIGLSAGVAIMTVLMLLWNYLITPIYMIMPRESVAELLVPVFLPFNLLKGGLNMAITLLLYRPLVTALQKTGLVEQKGEKKKTKPGILLVGFLILVTCVLLILVWKGIL